MNQHNYILPCTISTSKVILKRYNIGDGRVLLEYINNNRTRIYEHFGRQYSEVIDELTAEKYINDRLCQWYLGKSYSFAIWDRMSKIIIGQKTVDDCHWWHSKAEVDYHIDKNFEGQGITSEVLSAVVKFSFENLTLNKLNLRTAQNNLASQKVASKNGFEFEGVLIDDYRKINGEYISMNRYGLSNAKYRNSILSS